MATYGRQLTAEERALTVCTATHRTGRSSAGSTCRKEPRTSASAASRRTGSSSQRAVPSTPSMWRRSAPSSPSRVVIPPLLAGVAESRPERPVSQRTLRRARVASHPFQRLDAEEREPGGQDALRDRTHREPRLPDDRLGLEHRTLLVEDRQSSGQVVEVGSELVRLQGLSHLVNHVAEAGQQQG